jgi:hypothetical protein
MDFIRHNSVVLGKYRRAVLRSIFSKPSVKSVIAE